MAFRFLYKLLSFDEFFRAIIIAFPTGRDSETFWDNGTEVPSLSRDKLKILPRDGTGRDSQNPGRDRPGQPKTGTGHGTKRDRAEKDVLKQKKDALKQKRTF